MPLSDATLRSMLSQGQLIRKADQDSALVNPASIDIRLGNTLLLEKRVTGLAKYVGPIEWATVDLRETDEHHPHWLEPKQFVLVETWEHFLIPNGFSMHLYMKSSRAREGYDCALAFWFDPGWDGIGTLEIVNNLQHHALPLYRGLRFGQIVVERNDGKSQNPYAGRYQGAKGVEASKD